MGISISKRLIEEIKSIGAKSYPDECCGFLLGKFDESQKQVRAILGVANEREAAQQFHRYLIAPDAYQRAEASAREQGWEILGFYHSHPDTAALPSDYDLQHAWPWYSYIIVSVMKGNAAGLTGWSLQDDRGAFSEEAITIVNSRGTDT